MAKGKKSNVSLMKPISGRPGYLVYSGRFVNVRDKVRRVVGTAYLPEENVLYRDQVDPNGAKGK
jgi:hypothetical protein